MTQTLCRRCLLKESQRDKLYRSVMEFIDAIPTEEKTPKKDYSRRLGLCRTCHYLINGMCSLCGCFVEVRAAKVKQRCAKNIW